VTNTFSIKTQSVDVLFDFGATHYFISIKLVEILRLVPTSRHPLLFVALPNGMTVNVMNYIKTSLSKFTAMSSWLICINLSEPTLV